MFWPFCVSIIVGLMVANAQPLSCQEDEQCLGGYYCETQANLCRACLRCKDVKRESPKENTTNVCIKSIMRCGPCFDGFINIYGKGMKGKCVLPDIFEFGSGSHYAFVWITAAVFTLIIAGFIYVVRHTHVYTVEAYYNLGSKTFDETLTPVTIITPRRLLKLLLHFETDAINES